MLQCTILILLKSILNLCGTGYRFKHTPIDGRPLSLFHKHFNSTPVSFEGLSQL